jgi:hypothetical protein
LRRAAVFFCFECHGTLRSRVKEHRGAAEVRPGTQPKAEQVYHPEKHAA